MENTMNWGLSLNRFRREEKVFKNEIAYLIGVLSVNPSITYDELKNKVSDKIKNGMLSSLIEYLVYKKFKHPVIDKTIYLMKLNRPDYYKYL